MDLYSVERIVEVMTKHLISMSIINEAETLFEEYVSNEKRIFQDYLITENFMKEAVQTIFPNSLIYQWASS